MNWINELMIMKWTKLNLSILNRFCVIFCLVVVSEQQTTRWKCFWESSSTKDKRYEQSKINVISFRVIFAVSHQNQQNGSCQMLHYGQNDDEHTQVIITWDSNGNSFLLTLDSQLAQQSVFLEWMKQTLETIFSELGVLCSKYG